jgi:DNA-binding Lrp family transcriptional regulator
MILAYVLITAEPARVKELVGELTDMQLDASVIKSVHATTGQYNLIALVESPTLQDLGT